MKNKTYIILGVIFAAAALAFAFYKPFLTWLQKQKAQNLTVDTYEGVKTQPGVTSFPLKKGKSGIQVLYFQAWLNVFRGATIETLDGIWGQETERECNQHFKSNSISQAEYGTLILPNMIQLNSYLASKGIKA